MIHFLTLGSLDLRNPAGEEIQSVTAQPKRLALLAYLAAATPGGFHRRDTLLGLFWPESDNERGRSALRTAIYKLRQSLGERVVEGRGDDEIGIGEGRLRCDVSAFEEAIEQGELAAALEIYRGDFMEGFFLSETPGFERWLEGTRARLRGKALEAARELARREEAGGNLLAAVRWARRAVELEPDGEVDLRRLMSLLDRGGDRAGALRAYEDFARRLSEQHEVDPSPETRALLQSVRVREKASAAPPAAGAPELPSADPDPLPARPAPVEPVVKGHRPRRWVPTAALLLLSALLVAVGLAAVRQRPPAPGEDRVVVAAFENLTGDPALEPLGRMAADWITQGLARSGAVDVVPTSTVLMAAKGMEDQGGYDLQTLARETRAGTLVSGAVYRSGDSIYFQAQITDVVTGRTRVSVDPVGGLQKAPLVAVEALRSEVTGALAAHFNERFGKLATPASHPPNFEAYRESLEGMEHFIALRWPQAVTHFRRAADLDSVYAPPLVFGAISHTNLGQWAQADSLAQRLGRRRELLAPFDLHILDWLNAYIAGDSRRALEAMRRATALAPESEWVFVLGLSAMNDGRPGETVEALERLDPERGWTRGWTPYWALLTGAHHGLGDHQRELEAARRGRRQYPEDLNVLASEVYALSALGEVELVEKRLKEALLLPSLGSLTPATVAHGTALELRAHGHPEAAERAMAYALAWYRARPAREQESPAHRMRYARALYDARQWSRAEPLFRELAALAPDDPATLGSVGVLAARRGDPAQARRISARLAELDRPYLRGAHTLWRARIAAVMAERERAVALLRQALLQGVRRGGGLHTDTDLENLRGYAPFEALLTADSRVVRPILKIGPA